MTYQWTITLEDWTKSLKCSNTQRVYRAGVVKLLAFTGKQLNEIKYQDVLNWTNNMRERHLAESTIQLALCGVSSFYKFAVEDCELPWVGKLPAAGRILRRRIEPYGKAIWMTTEETRKLLSDVDRTTANGARDYALLLGYLLTGRRNTEWRTARLSDFERRGSQVVFRWSGKGKRDQKQAIPGPVWAAVQALMAMKQIAPDGYLFTAQTLARSEPLSSREVGRIVKKYAAHAGLDVRRIHVHTLRHTAAMLRKEAGAGLEEIMGFLAHSNLAITQIYLHSLEVKEDNSWERASELLGV